MKLIAIIVSIALGAMLLAGQASAASPKDTPAIPGGTLACSSFSNYPETLETLCNENKANGIYGQPPYTVAPDNWVAHHWSYIGTATGDGQTWGDCWMLPGDPMWFNTPDLLNLYRCSGDDFDSLDGYMN